MEDIDIIQYIEALDSRLMLIEKILNKVQTAVTNLASQQQLRSLVFLKQKEIADLTARVAALESQVSVLQQGK